MIDHNDLEQLAYQAQELLRLAADDEHRTPEQAAAAYDFARALRGLLEAFDGKDIDTHFQADCWARLFAYRMNTAPPAERKPRVTVKMGQPLDFSRFRGAVQ